MNQTQTYIRRCINIKNIQFDALHFHNTAGADGIIYQAVKDSTRRSVRIATTLLSLHVALVLLVACVVFAENILVGAITLLFTLGFVYICWIGTIKALYTIAHEMKTDRYWHQRLIHYKRHSDYYDKLLDITIDDLIDDIEALRTVYFRASDLSTYIPIEHIESKSDRLDTITFADIPEDYHTLDHFKQILSREELAKMIEHADEIKPSFADVIEIIQLKARIQLIEEYSGTEECTQ